MQRRKTGDGVGKPAPSTLPFEEQRALAHEAALRLLTVRERSAAELRQRLRQKGYSPEVIIAVLDRLAESGLQDDARFAERFAEEAARGRGYAARRIRGELLRKGIGRDLAAVASTTDPDEEEARAETLARSRAARMRGSPPEVVARRITGLLARRGFDADVCRRVASSVAGEARDEASAPPD